MPPLRTPSGKGGGVNAMTCYSVQFHLSNKTDVVVLWSFFPVKREEGEEEVWRSGCGWQAISQ